MESSFLSQSTYLIVEKNGEYFFDTDQEATYWIYFTEADGYVPSASFAENIKMFGFEQTSPRKNKGDVNERVQITILDILRRFFIAYPEFILLYVCSDESVKISPKTGEKFRDIRFAQKRSEIFSEWFDKWQQAGLMPAEKIDFCLYGNTYCSCFFMSGNPHETEVRQVIEKTAIKKQPY